MLTADNDDLNIYTKDMCSVKLFLNKTNINNKECPFLDLSIHINYGKLYTKTYDERDGFSLPISNDVIGPAAACPVE